MWPKVHTFCIIAICNSIQAQLHEVYLNDNPLWGSKYPQDESKKHEIFEKEKNIKNSDLCKGGWVEHEFYDLELPILRGPGGQGVHVPDQLVLKNKNQFFNSFYAFLTQKIKFW